MRLKIDIVQNTLFKKRVENDQIEQLSEATF